jgi:4-amino-4-deoxy-L-arabinose transferase-like glycosyltransferase
MKLTHKTLFWALIAVFFTLALAIRFYDLTDPPFDFHPTRQWRSVLIARGMYFQNLETVPDWQRETAVAQWKREAIIEPPVLEVLAVGVYHLIGSEQLWVARAISSVFWVLGGAAVLLFGREIGALYGGALAAVYFLFLPYGMVASRTFQPDPLMVALIAGSFWAAARWHTRPSLRSAVLLGLLAGAAVFVKTVAVFILGGALIGLVLASKGLRQALRDRQVWIIGSLAVLPTGIYYLYGLFINGFLRQQMNLRFFPEMWRDPAFYIRWVEMSTDIAGFSITLAALVGVFLLRDRALRGLALGAWLGYAAYSFTFPFHTITHDYYQLPLIPIVAMTIVPVAGLLFAAVESRENRRTIQAVLALVVLAAVLFKAWDTRVILAREDFRIAETEWARFQDIIPPGKKVVAITKAYGMPLAYYGWVNASIWLNDSDAELRALAGQSQEMIQNKRLNQLEGKDLFLITNFSEFERQEGLSEFLYSSYEVFEEGSGYLIFDLNQPASPGSQD